MELNVLGLQPRSFNCQLEKVKSQKRGTFEKVKFKLAVIFVRFSDDSDSDDSDSDDIDNDGSYSDDSHSDDTAFQM